MNNSNLKNEIFNNVKKHLCKDGFWNSYLKDVLEEKIKVRIHLAIFVEPYLKYILEGKKTIESRFSTRKIIPYKRVASGDIIILKRSGGPITGIAKVSDVWNYELDKESWRYLKKDYTDSLCAHDPNFWKMRESASFVTLMKIREVRRVPPIDIEKKDRRSWIILFSSKEQIQLL